MTLGEVIAQYRKEHNLSQRQMGGQCGLSTGYISLIEKEINPQTGKAMVPTLTVLNKIAKGMGMTIDGLIAICDDMPVDMTEKKSNTENREEFQTLKSQIVKEYGAKVWADLNLYLRLDTEDRAEIRGTMKQMLRSDKYSFTQEYKNA